MEGQLKNGTILTSESGNKYEVVSLLGAGGQGEVYDVKCGSNHYALNGTLKEVPQNARKRFWKRSLPKVHRMKAFSGLWN